MPEEVTLKAADEAVRETMTYARDTPVGGYPDNWTLPHDGQTEGDCEDFAMRAAHVLRESGVSPDLMYFSLFHTEAGAGFNHCALLVETPEGLMTCGDTYWPEVSPIDEVYPKSTRRYWARLDDPTNWRIWA